MILHGRGKHSRFSQQGGTVTVVVAPSEVSAFPFAG